MVGDGINGRTRAGPRSCRLAIGGTGRRPPPKAGDIVFMGDPLRSLPLLVRLSREDGADHSQRTSSCRLRRQCVGVVITAWLWPLLAPGGLGG